MRPAKLTMSAFGPYAATTEIDFDALGKSGVYLVCGDTGSGKTIIFDAICFALFGEASGDARGGARSTSSLRSDYAEATARTFVELRFEYRGKLYRVKRNPDYTRAKERGRGETKQPAGAEIELPDGRVISGVRKVNTQIEELLGIDCDQFKQIVMLAQGEFRKLLTADTDTREVIFRKLFGTKVYERLQDRLAEESRALERENVRVKSQIATLASQAVFPEGSEMAHELEERRKGRGQLGAWLLEALEELLAVEQPEHERLDAEVEDLRAKWSDANLTLKQAEMRPAAEAEKSRLDAELERLRALEPKLVAALDDQRGHDAEREEAIATAVRIEGTFGKYEELRVAEGTKAAASDASEQAQRELAASEEEHEKIARELERLDVESSRLDGADMRLVQAQAELEAAKRAAETAQKALDDVLAAEKRESEAAKAQAAFVGMQAARDSAAASERDYADAVAEARAKAEAFAGVEVAFVEKRTALEQARRLVVEAESRRNRREVLATERRDAEEPCRRAQAELVEKEQVYAKDEQSLHDLQRRQRAGRAGLLALDLSADMPCPVCGSLDHPAPAKVEGAIPTDEEIDAASARAERSKAVTTELSVEAGKLQAVLLEKGRLLDEFDAQYGGEPGVQRAVEAAEETCEAARLAHDDAVARVGEAKDARRALELATKRHEQAQALLAEADAALRKARESQIAAEHAARAMREGLGDLDSTTARDARDEAAAALARVHAIADSAARDARELTQTQQALSAARDADRKAREKREAAQTRVRECVANLTLATERVAHLRSDVEFADLAAARGEAASLRKRAGELSDARSAAEKAVRENASARATTAALAEAASKRLDTIPLVDVEAVKAQMDALTVQGNELKAKAAALKTRIDANEACHQRLRGALAKAGDIEERYGRVKMLADAATGNLVGRPKVRFEAYVQAIYFDKVIAAANERLKVLTSGQFELMRYSEGVGNAKAGLGLYVIDSFTGRARDASSLSGGESFQASLCLALGLSDIVQAHAGGIEFDTMFVDEGFGSLDAGALGNAISLLSDLSGGTKLVGIISHVEDLKANIPKKLVVTKSRTGSSVKMDL